MKWLKQIFGVKEDEPEIKQGALDALMAKKFQDATKTNVLVVSSHGTNTSETKTYTQRSLSKYTKIQLEELARSEFGLELDRRKKKSMLITEIVNAQ